MTRISDDTLDGHAQAVLRARAVALAAPIDDTSGEAQQLIEVLEFRLASERYAAETRYVQEVHPLKHLTPLPCTPSFVLGIVNVRGQVATVLSLKRFFDLPEQGVTDLHRIVLIGNGELGLLADLAVAVHCIARSALQTPLPTLTGIGAHYVKGVTGDGLVLLDIERLLADPRLVVDEEADFNDGGAE